MSTTLVNREHLQISAFGGCQLFTKADEPIKVANRKGRAILAYLATKKGGRASRETLAALLWSESDESRARASLRQCLRQLRIQLENARFHELLRLSGEDIVLDADLVSFDLTELMEQLDNHDVVANLYDSHFLPERIFDGYDDIDPSFTSWVRVLRSKWEDIYVAYLRKILGSDNTKDVRAAAETLVAIDPTHEEGHRSLIRLSADMGNIPAALRQYQMLWNLLGDEYDMEPDHETQTLIAEIKSGTYVGTVQQNLNAPIRSDLVPRLPQVETPRLPMIELHKFVRVGPWEGEDFLIEGVRRDLLAALVRFREWVVVEGNSALIQTGLTSGSDYSVECSYYQDDENINLVITLKDLARSHYIWSERLSLSPENWIQARREIIRKLSVSLNIYLSADRLRQGLPNAESGERVYARWLAAQELSYRWRPQDELEAEQQFRELIAEAPSFAPAYSSLVQIMNSRHHVFPGRRRSKAQHQEALDFARKAVDCDPLDCRTQLCLAWSYAMNGKFAQAAMSFRLAYSLNENDPWVLVSCALGLAYCDAIEEALAMDREVQNLDLELSPLHWAYAAGVRFICGDLEGCVEAADAAEDSTFYIGGWKAAALANLGKLDEARTTAAEFAESIRVNWNGEAEPTREEIGTWFLDAFPIRDPEVHSNLRSGLAKAGIRSQA